MQLSFFSILLALCLAAVEAKLLICSDSTTANYASGPLQGWGFYIHEYLTTPVVNLAKNGRSTRSFIREGLWKTLLSQTQAGDVVIVEMGHNDNGDPTGNDKGADRRTLKGTGEQTAMGRTDQGTEKVYTFGHYLRTMVKDVQARQGIAVLSGMVPTNVWEGNSMRPSDKFPFTQWTKEVAKEVGVEFLDHTKYSGKRFTAMGPAKTKTLFPNDSTHTSPAGAEVNAQSLVDAIKCNGEKSALFKYLNAEGQAMKPAC